jgi:hypothetical protein
MMRAVRVFLICAVLLTTTLIGVPAERELLSEPTGATLVSIGAVGLGSPQVSAVQVFYKKKAVDVLVEGKKLKKYSIEISGSGFVPGSSAVIDEFGSLKAYPYSRQPAVTLETTFISDTSLEARFASGAPLPGLLLLKVVNPDFEESQASTLTVISDPADLSLSRIRPESGAIGTVVTVTGVGFATAATSGENSIRFESVAPAWSSFVGFGVSRSADGDSLTFVIPFGETVLCPGIPPCPGAFVALKPGQYRLSVINPNGLSNTMLFQLTNSN